MVEDVDFQKIATVESLETAYFQLRCNLLRNNKPLMDYYLGLIDKISSFSPDLMCQMNPYYVKELDKIREIIRQGGSPFSLADPIPDDGVMKVFSNKKFQYDAEKDLKNELFYGDGLKSINQICGLELKPIGIEVKSNYGYIDILAKQDKEIWVIELKKSRGDFKLVSQISKYILAYEEKLINKTFNSVHSIAIANGFSKYAIQNLKKMGTLVIHYEKICNRLVLKTI